jgi:hypothetical protein
MGLGAGSNTHERRMLYMTSMDAQAAGLCSAGNGASSYGMAAPDSALSRAISGEMGAAAGGMAAFDLQCIGGGASEMMHSGADTTLIAADTTMLGQDTTMLGQDSSALFSPVCACTSLSHLQPLACSGSACQPICNPGRGAPG